MSLIESLERQYQSNEQALASSLNTPRVEFDIESHARLQCFVDWCKTQGVRPFPAAPGTVAAFAKAFHHSDALLATLRDIGLLHNQANLADPCASIQVRSVLRAILKVEPPKTWAAEEELLWAGLDPQVQGVILKRAEQTTKTIRTLQNSNAVLRKQLETLQPTKDENVTSET